MAVYWNGISLRSKGIIVEKIPNITKGAKRFKTYDISGRDGVLVIDEGTYDPFALSLECHLNEDNTNINEVKEFIDGYGTLSLDGVTQYNAIIQNNIDFEKIFRSGFRKFIIQFLVNPIASDIESTEVTISSSPTTFNNASTTKTYPILTIKGSGDVSFTFNNKTFYLYDLESSKTYTLDCGAKEIYDNNNNNCSNLMKYDFPYLIKGNNTISYTGTITQFKITYNKTYI